MLIRCVEVLDGVVRVGVAHAIDIPIQPHADAQVTTACVVYHATSITTAVA